MTHPDKDLIALGIRQPWAELILRGIKTIEVRSQATNVRGTIYVYTGQKIADIPAAGEIIHQYAIDPTVLPLGRLVGTVDIINSRPCTADDVDLACVPEEVLQGKQGWQLANPVRLKEPLEVRFLPYGVWFYPFKRRKTAGR